MGGTCPTSPAQNRRHSHSCSGVIDTPQREGLNDEYGAITQRTQGASVMKDKPAAAQRIHSEAPAEGDEAVGDEAAEADIRVHSQEPAEGLDPDEE